MSDEKTRDPLETEEKTTAEADAPGEEQAAPEETGTAGRDAKEEKGKKSASKKPKKDGKLQEELEKVKNELGETNDKYLRMMAEYDNFRRRSAKERESIYADACCDTLKEILPVIDNLERAASVGGNDKVTEGVLMTLNQCKATFEKLGVEEIACEPGTPFDPECHHAVMHIEDESLAENVIAEVFQKGYRKGEKILRFTMVKVAN